MYNQNRLPSYPAAAPGCSCGLGEINLSGLMSGIPVKVNLEADKSVTDTLLMAVGMLCLTALVVTVIRKVNI